MTGEPRRREPAAPTSAERRPQPELLHADTQLIVLNKPAGMLSVPGRGRDPSLPRWLRGRMGFREDEPMRVVHRLDRDTSGVIVYARTLEAQRSLVDQFKSRRVEKVYLALVSGHVLEDGRIDLPLDVERGRTRARIARRRGKPAVTEYRVVERLAGNTLLECRPLTGRTHQLRVHLAAIGHPLTVDPDYGGGERLLLSHYKPRYRPNRRGQEKPLIERLTLHAQRLTLEHPTDGGRVTFEAPLPKDFRAAISQLRRLSGGV